MVLLKYFWEQKCTWVNVWLFALPSHCCYAWVCICFAASTPEACYQKAAGNGFNQAQCSFKSVNFLLFCLEIVQQKSFFAFVYVGIQLDPQWTDFGFWNETNFFSLLGYIGQWESGRRDDAGLAFCRRSTKGNVQFLYRNQHYLHSRQWRTDFFFFFLHWSLKKKDKNTEEQERDFDQSGMKWDIKTNKGIKGTFIPRTKETDLLSRLIFISQTPFRVFASCLTSSTISFLFFLFALNKWTGRKLGVQLLL